MTNTEFFAISNPVEIFRLGNLLVGVLDGPELLKIDYLELRGWVAVPFESALHFDNVDVDRIATAAAKLSCLECNAIPTEGLAGPLYYRVPMTPRGLQAFNRKCAHFKYLLVPDNELFAVFCSTEDYCVAAGPRDFVEIVLAKGIEAARDDFRRYVESETLEPHRRFKAGIADRYQTVSGTN